MRALLGPTRAHDWWEHKLAPILATGYATACFAGTPQWDVIGTLLLVVLALVPGAAYVGLLNDLTDRKADRAAGRADRLAGRSLRAWWLTLAGTVAVGTAIAVAAWRDEPTALLLYASAWVAFAFYSVPPVRLKARGALGVLADAVGAQLCPHLLMATLVLDACGRGLDREWALAVGTWALAGGVRAAVGHQLADADDDARAGVGTFGRRHPLLARRLGTYVVFPVEAVAFVALLVLAGAVAALVLIPAYVLLQAGRVKRWGYSIVVVSPAAEPPYRIALHDFYVALFPLGVLATSTIRHPRDAIVLLVHLAAFHRTPLAMLGDLYRLIRFSSVWEPAR